MGSCEGAFVSNASYWICHWVPSKVIHCIEQILVYQGKITQKVVGQKTVSGLVLRGFGQESTVQEHEL